MENSLVRPGMLWVWFARMVRYSLPWLPALLHHHILFLVACEGNGIRVMFGSSEYEGTLEICENNIWGSIAGMAWGDTNAAVVCAELGFSRQGIE